MTDEWTGPFAAERRAAERDLESGADEIEYRGDTFIVNDANKGWIYVWNRHEYTSLDAVLDAMDAEKVSK